MKILENLTPMEKDNGVALICIQAEETAVAVLQEGRIVSYESFPVGSKAVEKDVAFVASVKLSEASSILGTVCKMSGGLGVEDKRFTGQDSSRLPLREVVRERLMEILDAARSIIEKMCAVSDLRCGVVVTGSIVTVVGVPEIEQMARAVLGEHCQVRHQR